MSIKHVEITTHTMIWEISINKTGSIIIANFNPCYLEKNMP